MASLNVLFLVVMEEPVLKRLPNESLDDYMKRWTNRNTDGEVRSSIYETISLSNENEYNVHSLAGNATKQSSDAKENELKEKGVEEEVEKSSYANVTKGSDIMFPIKVVQESCKCFSNTLFGYFLGNLLPFPVVDRYAGNVWKKFGLEKYMMNSSNFFYFKFSSQKGRIKVLEEGP